MKPNHSLIPLGILLLLTWAPGFVRGEENLLTTAAANGSFETLVSLVIAADLEDTLQGDGEFTLFAPSDEAFARLPAGTLDALRRPENRESLAALLKYHVLPREISVPKTNNHPLKSATTLSGDSLHFYRQGTEVAVNDARIVKRNIRCTNGLIHAIDGVLMPPVEDTSILGTARAAGGFDTLLAAVEAAGLTETLTQAGPWTLLAPTDKAFRKIPKATLESLLKPENQSQLVALLKYHLIEGSVSAQQALAAEKADAVEGGSLQFELTGGRLRVNQATVLKNDLSASNGVIHVIDQVLMPMSLGDSQPASAATSQEGSAPKVVTITSDWQTPVQRDGIETDTLIIKVGGAGRVALTGVHARRIETQIGGGGSVSIAGVAVEHQARVSGGAVLSAADLVTESTTIQVYGGGNARIHATRSLDASASAGADVKYVPTDAQVTKQINQYASFQPLDRTGDKH